MRDRISEAEILGALDVGVMACRADGRLRYANAAVFELCGVTLEELEGKTSEEFGWDVIDPDGHPIPYEDLATNRALRTRAPVKNLVLGVLRPHSRERVWLLANAIPQFDEHGELSGVVTSLSDISSRRALEDVLTESNARLDRRVAERTAELEQTVSALRDEIRWREEAQAELAQRQALHGSVVRAMAEGVIVHDARGRVVDANPAASHILGLGRDEIFGLRPPPQGWSILDAQGTPVSLDGLPSRIVLRTGEAVRNADLTVRRPDGSIRGLTVNCEPRREREGLGGLVLTFSDITERREAEQQLEQSLYRLQMLLTALPGVVIFMAEVPFFGSARVTYLSAGAEGLLGIPSDPGDVPIETFLDRIHPDDWPKLVENGQAPRSEPEAIDTLGDFVLEVRLRPRPEAPWRWASVRARPKMGRTSVTWTGTVVDIDEQLRVAEGLRQTQKMEAIGVLAAGVAHNFNNMLAAIIPNVEQAHSLVDSDLRPYLEDAVQAAHTAKELVRQLLVVARRDPTPEHVSVNLVPLLTGVVQLCRRSFRPDVRIQLDLQVSEAWVSASPSHLNQVFINLCTNARDAMFSRADAILTIRLQPVVPMGWEVTVADNGEGMPPETLQRLGEPFFTTKGPDRGTGLGVATAFGIVEDHSGELMYESTPGLGTTAIVRLPALETSQVLPHPPKGISVADAESLSGRILVVDDEELVRRAVRRTLVREGHEVLEAMDGLEAVDVVTDEGSSLDLVLLDLAMPGLSGRAVLADVKTREPLLPVILMTGLIDDDDHLGDADAVLRKPVERRELLGLVRDLVETRRRERISNAAP
ncbi:MAG: PAS domain-containing protein [Myxococcota bacterium]